MKIDITKVSEVLVHDKKYITDVISDKNLLNDLLIDYNHAITDIIIRPINGVKFTNLDAAILQGSLENLVPNTEINAAHRWSTENVCHYSVSDSRLQIDIEQGALRISTRTAALTEQPGEPSAYDNIRETDTLYRLALALRELGVEPEKLAKVFAKPEIAAAATRFQQSIPKPDAIIFGEHSPAAAKKISELTLKDLIAKMPAGSGFDTIGKGVAGSNKISGYSVRMNTDQAGLTPKDAASFARILTQLSGREFKTGTSSSGYNYVESATVGAKLDADSIKAMLKSELRVPTKETHRQERGPSDPNLPPRG